MKINLDEIKDLTPKYKRGGASRRRTLREGIDVESKPVYHLNKEKGVQRDTGGQND